MTPSQFRQVLLEKQHSLEKSIQERGEIHVTKSADPMDIATEQASRDAAAVNINRMTGLLREVRAALKRIDDGDYGICVDCEEDIPEKRLLAAPWAARCVPCQEALDSEMRARGEAKRLKEYTEDQKDDYRADRHSLGYRTRTLPPR